MYDHPTIESDPGHASRWPAARSQGILNLKAKERKKERHIELRKSLRISIGVPQKTLGRRKLQELQ